MGFNFHTKTVLPERIHISPGKSVVRRFLEICDETGLSPTALIKEAIRCYIVFYDRRLS